MADQNKTAKETWPDHIAEEIAKRYADRAIEPEEIEFYTTTVAIAYYLGVLSDEVLRLGEALVRERKAWTDESIKDSSARTKLMLDLALSGRLK